MKRKKPSRTAIRIALCRASESAKPESQRICYDPYAKYFLPWQYHIISRIPFLIQYIRKKGQKRSPGILEAVVARVRYMDDYLLKCLHNDLSQLVILGAGYDTRPYRMDGLKKKLSIFEVDHPTTQAVKKKKLKKIFGALPEHVRFVSVRFNSQSLKERLDASGYHPELKTVFIWEGMVMYLTQKTVETTLNFVKRNSGPGSSIIFDYIPGSLVSGPKALKEGRELKKFVRKKGEELIFTIEPDEIEQFLLDIGFVNIKQLDARDLEDVYFRGANVNRKISRVLRFISADTGD